MKLLLLTIFSFAFLFILGDTVYASTLARVAGGVVNVRTSAEVGDGNVATQISRGTTVEIVDVIGDFFRVSHNEEYLYISRDWLNIIETDGRIILPLTPAYDLPREEGGQPVLKLVYGDMVAVVSSFGEWYGISWADEVLFVEKSRVEIPSFAELPTARINTTIGDEMVEIAMRYLGARYVWGGTTPAGFDCSGFMVYILGHFDISVNRRSTDMARNGVHVERSDLMPGDLVFFSGSSGGRINHVGMYIGGGEFIHSSTTSTGVIISSMYRGNRSSRFVTARRVA